MPSRLAEVEQENSSIQGCYLEAHGLRTDDAVSGSARKARRMWVGFTY